MAQHNADHAAAIAAGAVAALEPSSVEFIGKASGIRARAGGKPWQIRDETTMLGRTPALARVPNR